MKLFAVLALILFVVLHTGTSCAWSQDSDSSSSYSDSSSTETSSSSDDSSSSSDAGSSSSDGSSSGDSSAASESGSSDKRDNLANLEALVNIMGAWGMGAGIVTSCSLFLSGVIIIGLRKTKRWLGGILIGWSFFSFGGAIMCPAILNWIMASAKDANLFS